MDFSLDSLTLLMQIPLVALKWSGVFEDRLTSGKARNKNMGHTK